MSLEPDEVPKTPEETTEIAIIGLAGRFPGARNLEAFWDNLRRGVESIRSLSDEQLLAAGVSSSELNHPDYVKASPLLDEIDKFDAQFFGISPRDASVMDPAHRFFLEVAWEAFEHAGYAALPEEGAVGVFAGSGAPLYMMENLRTNPELMRSMGDFLVRHTGNDMNFLATRVSYEMDLRGPSINVQTACSSALVAVHLACQSLLRRECTLALAGGSTILVPGDRGYLYKEGEILSPDGHCRPFDAQSAGTVFGSGAGCVVLKRLQDALDDGDTIHAVVKGSAINNDGALKVGFLAPGVDGQAAAVESALAAASVSPESISYIEAHGTGTLVGDPIEVTALIQAFRKHTDKRGFCALGSVKSNIGHLGEAAAAASLIKAILALKHRELPASLGYQQPNPAIDFERSPFYVNDRLRAWAAPGPLRCGITALGAGGTNCHVILEEAPERIEGEGARAAQLLVLSAKTRSALDAASERLANALEDASLDLADAAYTLALGRRGLPQRRALAVRDRADAIAKLRARDPKQVVTLQAESSAPSVVFMFPGGGAQYARMGLELYECEPVYREAVDACLALIQPELGRDLGKLMFASLADVESATRTLEQPSLTLPSLFATEYALAKLFQAWGVTPSACIGHSMGEYLAACLAEVITLREALQLVLLRGRLFEKVQRGGMLSVPLAEAELQRMLPPELQIAAVNAPELSVASGPMHAIEALEAALAQRGIEATRVRIDVAAHSAMLDPILDEFRKLCRTIRFQPPKLPFVSNLTGRWITPAQATDPEYWVKHLRAAVRFADGVQTLFEAGEAVLLELGPGRTLSMLARAQAKPARHAFNAMRHPQESASDLDYALTTLGRVWCAGAELDWSAFYAGQLRNRIPLPTYPFERQSFWVKPGLAAPAAQTTALTKRADLSTWFYRLSWVQKPLLRSAAASDAMQRWLVLAYDRDEGRALVHAIERWGDAVASLITPGEQLVFDRPGTCWVDFRSPAQVAELIRSLDERGEQFDRVVYLAGRARVVPQIGWLRDLDLQQALSQSFFAPTYLARALGALSEPLELTIVTSQVADVGQQRLDPRRATVLGPVHVTPREFPQLRVRCIDLPAGTQFSSQFLDELRARTDERFVALRAGERWVQEVLPQPLPRFEADPRAWLREHGVYLITGGLGGIGLEIARHFARQKPVKLVLVARNPMPAESEWSAAKQSPVDVQRIVKVRELRALGAEVRVEACDVTDRASMRALLARLRAELGPLNGVVHAAGLMDDAPMQNKSTEAMRRVLAPKVDGALVLDEVIDAPLDFFVLFSSVASFLGLPGQVDYTAANAFLDAFARERSRRAPGRTLVINWNAWREVGMAEAARRGDQHRLVAQHGSEHPALDGYSDEAEARVFVTDFSLARHWLLAEHKIKGGSALLPGTAFVELARAAFATGRPGVAVELTKLTFLSPFQLAEGETRRLSIHLIARGDVHELAMYTGTDGRGTPHVVGDVRADTRPAPAPLDLALIRARCDVREDMPKGRFLDQDFVAFGPRWANIVRVRYGRAEALLELELSQAFSSDLVGYGLHPALLDMATGGAQALIPGADLSRDFFVPLRYESMRVLAPMPRKFVSHVQLSPETAGELAVFDVTLCDEQGNVFAAIQRFTMKRLEAASALAPAAGGGGVRGEQRRNVVLDSLLREAILPSEGMEVFDRIMAQPGVVQAVASSVDVLTWQQQLSAAGTGAAQATGDAPPAPAGFSRPELATEYAAPATPSERALAELWSELVGVSQVGVNDDFFELGGNSLVAVRLFAAVKRRFQVSLPLAKLFEAPTIRQLAQLIDANRPLAELPAQPVAAVAAVPAPSPAAVSFQVASSDHSDYTPLVPIQVGSGVPFFCVHGAGGNVINFRDLAKLLGPQQSFYGLQAKGVTGGEPAGSIEEMASLYSAAIRQLRPSGPYMLGGYSGGGIVAYEMAQRLRAAGEPVLLVLFDTFHPACQARGPTRRERFEYLLAEGGAHYLERTGKAKLIRMAQGFASDLRIRYYQRRGLPLPFELRDLHVTRAFDAAASRYVTQPYAGPVTLYKASTTNAAFDHVGPTLGWAEYVSQLEVVEVPGDHNTVMVEPNVQVLIRHLKTLIAAVTREHAEVGAERSSEIAAQ